MRLTHGRVLPDGSQRAAQILPLVEGLALRLGATIVLLRCQEFSSSITPAGLAFSGSYISDLPTRAEVVDALEPQTARLERAGLKVEVQIERGDVARRILEVTRAAEIDLIALATHGRSGLDRVLFGSVTEHVLRRAPVPVLVQRSLPVTKTPASGLTASEPALG